MSDLISFPKVKLTKTAAIFEDGIDIKEWAEVGREMCKMHSGLQWWIGDWVNFGERTYQRNKEALSFFGKEILGEQGGFDVGTIRHYAWVSRKVKPCSRLHSLSHGHHEAVAAISDEEAQRGWLRRAKSGENGKQWTVARLREEIRAEGKQVTEKDTDPCPTITKHMTEAVCWIGREDAKMPIERWDKERCELILLSMQRIEPFKQRLVDRIRVVDERRTNKSGNALKN